MYPYNSTVYQQTLWKSYRIVRMRFWFLYFSKRDIKANAVCDKVNSPFSMVVTFNRETIWYLYIIISLNVFTMYFTHTSTKLHWDLSTCINYEFMFAYSRLSYIHTSSISFKFAYFTKCFLSNFAVFPCNIYFCFWFCRGRLNWHCTSKNINYSYYKICIGRRHEINNYRNGKK